MRTMVVTRPTIETQPEMIIPRELTPEELLGMPDAGRFELIDGELRERKVSFLSCVISGEIAVIVGSYCREHKLGWLPSADQGYRCFPWKPGLVRRPDVSFVRTERVSPERWDEGFCTIPPDLAVEVVSPNDLVEELDQKVKEYLRRECDSYGSSVPSCAVQVFRSAGSESWLWEDHELTGEDVIPGFRCRVADFFPKEAEAPARPEPGPESDQA